MQKRLKQAVRNIVVAGILANALQGFAQQKSPTTELGIQNPYTPEAAREMGARAVRVIGVPLDLKSKKTDELMSYKKAGFTVVGTMVCWDRKKALPAKNSAEWKNTMDRFEQFLRSAGPTMDYCTLANEPIGERVPADLASQEGSDIPAVEWFKALAERAQKVIKSDVRLCHIKISSPATILPEPMGPAAQARKTAADELLNWAINDSNIDVIDIHMHISSVKMLEDAIISVQQKTQKPIISTEWSQARVAKTLMDQKVDGAFAKKWSVRADQTRTSYIRACYKKPVEKAEWDEFVATFPYDPNFLNDAFLVMVRHNIAVATYGAHRQYGAPIFDLKQFLATQTVVPGRDGKPQENYFFATWFRKLANDYYGTARD